jgi:hypothetical protein
MTTVARAGAIALALAALPTTVQAQDGLAGMHSWVRVGGRTCLVGHFHDGSATGKSKEEALRAAIKAWESFTAWEYSHRWGRFSAAASRSTNCTGTRGDFTCNVSGRPCKY